MLRAELTQAENCQSNTEDRRTKGIAFPHVSFSKPARQFHRFLLRRGPFNVDRPALAFDSLGNELDTDPRRDTGMSEQFTIQF
jgi:hypothetical protein